jgi:hypothetical protein
MRWLCIIIIALCGWIQADTNIWSSGTAYSLPKGQWETGLFQPVRYGLNDDQDIVLHPFFALKLPNLVFKKTWTEKNSWTIASRHGFYYPTPLLQSITGAGKFKIVAPQFEFPTLIGLTNEILATRSVGTGQLTGKAGLLLGLGGGDLDPLSTIDIPLVYPRLAVYYNGWGLRLGSDYVAPIKGRWSGFVDGDVFLYPGSSSALFFETKVLLIWTKSSRLRLMVGYKLTYGKYPFGSHWQILPPKLPTFPVGWPLIDIQITW